MQFASGVGFTIEDNSRGFGINEQRSPALHGPSRGHLQLQQRGPAPRQAVPHQGLPGRLELSAQVYNLFNSDNYTALQPVHPAAARGQRGLRRADARGPQAALPVRRVVSVLTRSERSRGPPPRLHRRGAARLCGARGARTARPSPALPRCSTTSRRAPSASSGTSTIRGRGCVPDRWPSPLALLSIAAVGFALTAYPIGVERGYVTRAAAAARVLKTLRFFDGAPQGPEPVGRTGHRGFFYHFLDMQTGHAVGAGRRALDHRHDAAAGGRAVLPVVLRPGRPGRGGDPRAGRPHLRPRRLELGGAALAHRQHGLAARGRPLPVGVADLRRVDDPLHPGPRLTHAPAARRCLARVHGAARSCASTAARPT